AGARPWTLAVPAPGDAAVLQEPAARSVRPRHLVVTRLRSRRAPARGRAARLLLLHAHALRLAPGGGAWSGAGSGSGSAARAAERLRGVSSARGLCRDLRGRPAADRECVRPRRRG